MRKHTSANVPSSRRRASARRIGASRNAKPVQGISLRNGAMLHKMRSLERTRLAMLNALEDLAEAKAKDEAILSNIGEGLVVTDNEEKLVFMNGRAEGMLRLTSKAWQGKNCQDIIHIEDAEGVAVPYASRPMRQSLLTRKKYVTPPSALYYFKRSDGTVFPVGMNVSPVDHEGASLGVVTLFHDMTEQLQIDRTKREFMSLAAHQLRTPLSIASMNVELLKADLADARLSGLPQDAHDALDRLGWSVAKMTSLVNTLLNVSSLEMGTLLPHVTLVDVRQCLEDALASLAPQIAVKRLAVDRRYGSDGPVMLATDGHLLQIAVDNLLSNAVKYNRDEGNIVIAMRRKDDRMIIEVGDTGFGISLDDQKKIFTKLFRSDLAKKVASEGNGLGLYMTKSVVEVLGGAISFTSDEGAGTTFFISLPAGMAVDETPYHSAVKLTQKNSAQLDRATVLIVEDEDAIRHTIARACSKEDLAVREAKDGRQGLESALAAHPDLIILDIVMPEMDGLSMLKQLRKDAWGAHAAVIIYSNLNSSDTLKEAGILLNADDILLKVSTPLVALMQRVRQKLGVMKRI